MLKRFLMLDNVLRNHQGLWRFEPFHQSYYHELNWASSYPAFSDWLVSLSHLDIKRYKNDTQALLFDAAEALPVCRELLALISIPIVSEEPIPIAKHFATGIPGRKLHQITKMGSYLLSNHPAGHWLEWCSGKGFLGRMLASGSEDSVVSFEWQHSLCEKGQREADKLGLDIHFVRGDALSEEAKKVVKTDQHAVALHACGDLHVRLLQHVCQAKSRAVSVSPCCYHLIESDYYQPLSGAAKNSGLALNKAELRIPLQETVTGGDRVSRHREEEMRYRLGFDLLLRQGLGMSAYIPIPSIKKSELAKGFRAFCFWAANKKEITLPSGIDFEHWEKAGAERFWRMERQSLAQQLFRRPLELWLVFDRALFLEEQGYRVSVAEFCHREETPRNILLHGERI